MEQTVVRTSDPREVVVYAEHALGFRPRQSVVAISLRGPRWRTGLVARLDLTDAGASQVVEAAAERLVADGAVRAVVLVHSDDPAPPGRGSGRGHAQAALDRLPHARVAAAWRRSLLAAGVEQVETWLVSSTRVRSYTCALACCPPQGLPLERTATQVGAELVLAGSVVAADRRAWERAQLAALAPASAAARRGVEAAARAVERAEHWPWREDPLVWWRTALEAVAGVARVGGDLGEAVADVLAPRFVGRLLVTLADHHQRDRVLTGLAPLLDPSGPGVDGEPGDAEPDDADPDAVEAALALLRAVVALAAPARRAEPLSLLAWVLWWRGQGAAAVLHAELALAADPQHRLADLVRQAAQHGVRARPVTERAGGPGRALRRSGGEGGQQASA